MKLIGLRVLPPLAIGRLGSSASPMDNFTIEADPDQPLGFREIIPAPTLIETENGEVECITPSAITFTTKEAGAKEANTKDARIHIRPVAPFLEVFALVEGETEPRPLNAALIESLGLANAQMEWRVRVANRKVERRTGDPKDSVTACTDWFGDYGNHLLKGTSDNFVADKVIDFGSVRFVVPAGPGADPKLQQIRLRFTPGKGLIYGPAEVEDKVIPEDRRVYDAAKGNWAGFTADDATNETLPPSLYAIKPPAPSWLNDNIANSRGYLDDACDGIVEFRLTARGGAEFHASARICAAPPMVIPDSLFVRSLADDLEQVICGPAVSDQESYEVTRARAADIVRRAYETVRFMNVALLNGNDFSGRPSLTLDSMPQEESADTERAIRPVMPPTTVDTFTIMALHQQVYTALMSGAAPWFLKLLRQPHEAADYTDRGRRKMPALMCGADNNYLALTYRQIDTIRKAADEGLFQNQVVAKPSQLKIEPLNLTAQLNWEALGNPVSSRPVSSVANCCPGLEFDFRAVWRRVFKGIVLREYDNRVMGVDSDAPDLVKVLAGHKLDQIQITENRELPVVTKGAPRFVELESYLRLDVEADPSGNQLSDWWYMLAFILSKCQGNELPCTFDAGTANETTVSLKVRCPSAGAAEGKEKPKVDLRDLWRTMFAGIVLNESDNTVKSIDGGVTDPAIRNLPGRRLDRIRMDRQIRTTGTIKGPAPSDPRGFIKLTTEANPAGTASLEWSNTLAFILSRYQGSTLACTFSKDGNTTTQPLEVRNFFEAGTAVISPELAKPGELTQGLCSPWQNDYRECSCYYWASARPDYVNVQPAANGLSKGDNWFQKKRTGDYVPDDYQDERLVLYDNLFKDWERWLRFQVGGQDFTVSGAEPAASPKILKAET